jgi:hypothetical protein
MTKPAPSVSMPIRETSPRFGENSFRMIPPS